MNAATGKQSTPIRIAGPTKLLKGTSAPITPASRQWAISDKAMKITAMAHSIQ